MKNAITLLFVCFFSATVTAQTNWQKGGNNNAPFASPASIGTDATWNSPLTFLTNGNSRMLIANGGLAATDGRIAMFNILPIGFVPQDRLHLHQTTGLTAMRFTNGVTGFTATDGFQVGIAELGGGIIQHYRPGTPISIGTNNSAAGVAYRMRIYSYADNGFVALV